MFKKSIWYDNVSKDLNRTTVTVFLEEGQKASDVKKEIKSEFDKRHLDVAFSNIERTVMKSYSCYGGFRNPSKVQRKLTFKMTRRFI